MLIQCTYMYTCIYMWVYIHIYFSVDEHVIWLTGVSSAAKHNNMPRTINYCWESLGLKVVVALSHMVHTFIYRFFYRLPSWVPSLVVGLILIPTRNGERSFFVHMSFSVVLFLLLLAWQKIEYQWVLSCIFLIVDHVEHCHPDYPTMLMCSLSFNNHLLISLASALSMTLFYLLSIFWVTFICIFEIFIVC